MCIMQKWAKEYLEQGAGCKYEIFAKFIILWMSFNGYTKEKYKTKTRNYKTDRDQLNDFIANHDTAKAIYSALVKKNSPELLSFFHYVQDKPEHKKGIYNYLYDKLVSYDNKNSFEQFINAIYQIRCNLVHCSKDLTDEHDQQLITQAFGVFKLFLKQLEESHCS